MNSSSELLEFVSLGSYEYAKMVGSTFSVLAAYRIEIRVVFLLFRVHRSSYQGPMIRGGTIST